jgi:ABC-type dipeptide/oligopeptide/nickel transport system permease component
VLRPKDLLVIVIVIALIWFIGMVVTVGVGRSRIGMTQRGTLPIELILRSLPWFLTTMVVIAFWPVVLALWLVRGRPPTPWELVKSPRDNGLIVRRITNTGNADLR